MKALGARRVKLEIGQDWETPYLHILLTREENVVVARCLDFTVSSHGHDEEQAIESLAEAIGEYIQSAIENDSIGQIYDPAYGKYWRMFNMGRKPLFYLMLWKTWLKSSICLGIYLTNKS